MISINEDIINNSKNFSLQKQRGRVKLSACCIFMGNDICFCLYGGERPHIGALALAEFREDELSKEHIHTSSLTCYKHKEEELAIRIAKFLANNLKTTIAVCCGIHVPNITKDELLIVDCLATEMAENFISTITKKLK